MIKLVTAKRVGFKSLTPFVRKAPVSTFSIGSRVVVVDPQASRFKCRAGECGVVVKCCLLSGCHDTRPASDLYFVLLDSGVLVYCNYPQLRVE